MPFRRKPTPSNVRCVISLDHNIRGVTTNKGGHLVQFESEQEHKLILLLERDATVADYLSQPETIYFQDANGHQRHYTPDFKVWRTHGPIELHEVTVATRRESHESLILREKAARAICAERGWHYVIHTDETLPSAYEYANLDSLSAFRAQLYEQTALTAWWLERLAGKEPLHPRVPLARAPPDLEPGPLLNNLYHLLWRGAIQMDWRQPLFWRDDFHPAARIWLPSPRRCEGVRMNTSTPLTASDLLQVGHWFQREGRLFEITTWDAAQPLKLEARAAEGAIQTFTLTELFAPTPPTRFATTQAELLKGSTPQAMPTIADSASLPSALLERADRIIQIVETVQNQIAETIRHNRLTGETFALTTLTRQACRELPAPICLSSYYDYRHLYQTHHADRALIAAALHRNTYGKAKMDPNAQHFIDTIIRRFYHRNPP